MTQPAERHVVLTGPIRGDITLDDGTVVDVRPMEVVVDSHEQAMELADKIGEHYATHGHPHHDTGDVFVHDAEQSAENFRAAQEG